MKIKISNGAQEDGIVVGNVYDKYNSSNPIVKWIMQGFESALSDLIIEASPRSIHEIGCGEGYWVLRWNKQGILARGSDFSSQVIQTAQENALKHAYSPALFESRSIYQLEADRDSADLVICCEVLEHLSQPKAALAALQRIVTQYLIVSVPREPLWCALNLARGKYLSHWGNTPGHLQHWSKPGFVRLISEYFNVVAIKTPLPWTMLLCRRF